MATTIVTKSGSGAPTASDLVAGELAVDLTNKRLYTEDSGGTILELGTNPSGNVTFGDNGKAIFGAGSDLQIYHDSATNTNYLEALSSNVAIDTAQFVVRNPSKDTNLFWSPTDGGGKYTAILGHETGGTKLQTTATGIDVTGSVTADGLTVDGAATIDGGATDNTVLTLDSGTANTYLKIADSNSTNGVFIGAATNDLNFYPNNTLSAKFAAGGDISFYEDTGTTPKFVWDASAESLGIGTSSPAAPLDIKLAGTVTADIFKFQRSDGAVAGVLNYNGTDGAISLGTTTTHPLAFDTNNVERMRIGASGETTITADTASDWALAVSNGTNSNAFGLYVNAPSASGIPLRVDGGGTERMRIDANGNTGIGGTAGERLTVTAPNPADGLVASLRNSGTSGLTGTKLWFNQNTVDNWNIGQPAGVNAFVFCNSTGSTAERMRIDASGNVGIGTVPSADSYFRSLEIGNTGSGITGRGAADTHFMSGLIWDGTSTQEYTVSSVAVGKYQITDGIHYWATAPAGTAGAVATPQTNMMLDASGNLLVGKTALNTNTAGLQLENDGYLSACRDGGNVVLVNRKSSDGALVTLQKDGTTEGSIGVASNVLTIFATSSANCGIGFYSNSTVRPLNNSGALSDNAIDLGDSGTRWDDIYATNGTIQTSDRNEKQDIAELSDAEQRVAVAAKGLLRKFRWKSSVAEKGDEARTHFGIIAQDLQAAFAAEGLDAGDYAMFINSTWTDEETGEERSRMGVRYSELLAFIIAAI